MKKVQYNTRTGRIIVYAGNRTYTFNRHQRKQAFDFIRRLFGRHLGKALIDSIRAR